MVECWSHAFPTLKTRIVRMLWRLTDSGLKAPHSDQELSWDLGDVFFMDCLLVLKRDLRAVLVLPVSEQTQLQQQLQAQFSAHLDLSARQLHTSLGVIAF